MADLAVSVLGHLNVSENRDSEDEDNPVLGSFDQVFVYLYIV